METEMRGGQWQEALGRWSKLRGRPVHRPGGGSPAG